MGKNWVNRLHNRSDINKNIVQSSTFMITLQQQQQLSTPLPNRKSTSGRQDLQQLPINLHQSHPG